MDAQDLNEIFPTEFRGCMWDDHWEFDAPCVIYTPKKFRRFGIGGSGGYLETMIEDVCIDLAIGQKPTDGGLKRECEWRGWGPRFDRRRDAWHVVIKVHWYRDRHGEIAFEFKEMSEFKGPPSLGCKADR